MCNLLFSSTRLFLCLAMMIFTHLIHAQQQKTVFPNPQGFISTDAQPLIMNTPDGGWMIMNDAGTANNMGENPWLIKLDATGQKTWDNTYLPNNDPNGYYYYQINSGINAPDGGWMVSIRDDSFGVELLKVAENGDLLWTKDIGQTPFGVDIIGIVNDQYYTVNQFGSNGTTLRKIDLSGNVISNITLGKPFYNSRFLIRDNQEILMLYWQSGKTYFSRFNLDGTELWTSQQLPAVTGGLYPAEGTDFFLVTSDGKKIKRLNQNAEEISTLSTSAFPEISTFNRILTCPDGNYLISGSTIVNRGYIAKIAPDYSLIWISEAPEDGQPDISALYGLPTADGWAVGAGVTTTQQTAFVRIGGNTGVTIKSITGRVARDSDNNCIADPTENGIKGTKVKASSTSTNEDFFGFSDLSGNYVIQVPSGDYTLTADPAQQFFFLCPGAVNTPVSLPTGGPGSVAADLPIQSLTPVHHLTGSVKFDDNENCTPDTDDTPLKSWRVITSGSGFYLNDYTDASGTYSMYMPDGDYTVKVLPLNPNFSVCGGGSAQVSFNSTTAQTETNDFVVQKAFDCAFMKTWVGGNSMRPCTTSTVNVFYQNMGTQLAENVRITVTLDPSLTYISSSLNPTSVNGNTLVFETGNLEPTYKEKAIKIDVLPDCNLSIGDQLCVTAEVIPNEICFALPGWNGAVVTITGECGPNPDQATFTISNIGNAANAAPLEFVIIEEQVVLKSGTFQLPAGGSQTETVNISGPVQVGTADQEPGYPGDTSVTYILNNCIGSGGNPTGFNGPASPFIHQACFNVVNSFDPNDKTARPEGFGPEHIVWPGTTLDYRIRFQNTGNDTAFLVTILDTLSADLDPGTIELKGSSHPYRFDLLAGKYMQFTFENILLPDSLTNPEGSQGYVEFSIKPRTNLPLGTTVGNSAAIYFDFNKPVITNTVYRKFDKYFEVTSVNTPGETVPVQIYPNPALVMAMIELPAAITTTGLTFELMDVTGRLMRREKFNGPKYQLICGDLAGGTYFWKISDNGKLIAKGKVNKF